ncbi:hypothetical protein B296_00002508 [Ensete ventricosum]|uniref:EF-hand domain-containing protein n=1 Tax=Ensete ventricosum TaxID=4639 RepID=A0A427AUJ0_ENSVE|nr:hypothetical protein B296_00002508 [Ensete ventricosum]
MSTAICVALLSGSSSLPPSIGQVQMSGYPPGSGYPHYGAPPGNPYGVPPPYGAAPPSPYVSAPPYAPSAPPAGEKPPKEGKTHGYGGYGQPGYYGQPPPATSAPPPPPPSGGYGGSPFPALMPSAFPPGTDPNVVACFQAADRDGSGFIDDKELQQALSSYNQSFSLRTVHLLMYLFTSSNVRKIGTFFLLPSLTEPLNTLFAGPKEFTAVFYSLQNWRV